MKTLFSKIGIAFSWFWKAISFIRGLVLNLLFLAVVGSIFYVVTADFSPEKIQVEQKQPQALLLDISGPIVEKRQQIVPLNFASQNLLSGNQVQENLLFDIVDKIRAAAKDNQINGMILSLTNLPETNLTKLRYIAKALNEFKATGKKIIAIGGFYSQSQYYLASYADEIYLASDGAVLLKGYGAYTLYFKELLDKLAINTHVFRVGEFKSAIEPFTRDNMSVQAREATSVWVDQLWQAYVADVAKNRDISPERVSPSAEQLIKAMTIVNGDTALLAKKLGLVDALLSRPEVRVKLTEQFGRDENNSVSSISIYDYHPLSPMPTTTNHIAVIVASGVIVDGVDDKGQIGGNSMAALLRKARDNDDIKAVVLRIDSPGGSAFASEVIRDEVIALKEAGKPIVVSMSSIAASGGYWIAANADSIIAQPTTLTGSIGIFGIITTVEKTLANYGIFTDGVGSTPFAGVSVTQALPESAATLMQLGIENGYQRFTHLVSTARDINADKMSSIAEGRVWTGQDAMANKLVDELGDFDDAVNAAATLAKLTDYQLNWMHQPLTPIQQFVYDLFSQTAQVLGLESSSTLTRLLGQIETQIATPLSLLTQFNDPQGHYVLCTDCLKP